MRSIVLNLEFSLPAQEGKLNFKDLPISELKQNRTRQSPSKDEKLLAYDTD